jgi:hypothetical protein
MMIYERKTQPLIIRTITCDNQDKDRWPAFLKSAVSACEDAPCVNMGGFTIAFVINSENYCCFNHSVIVIQA